MGVFLIFLLAISYGLPYLCLTGAVFVLFCAAAAYLEAEHWLWWRAWKRARSQPG